MTLSIIAICVVFSCLLILYFIYSILGKICSKDLPIPRKSADKDETVACTDSDPVPNTRDANPDIKHDLESGIITIVPKATNWTHQFPSASVLLTDTIPSGGSLSPDGFRSLRSLHPSQPCGWAPPSDVSEGGHAHRSQLPPDETATGVAGGSAWATEGPLTQLSGPSAAAGSPTAAPGIYSISGDKLPPAEPLSAGSAGPLTNRKIVYAPLPGIIIEMKVGRGQEVKRGDRIAVLEAMKMENDILAPIDGTITNVFVFKGDSVLEGAKIAEIE